MTDVITKAELARELNLSRARISQLCKIGLPVRPDGKLNHAEAVAWVKGNVFSWLGGWELRKKARGGADPAPMPATPLEDGMDVPESPDPSDLPELADFELPDLEGEIREQAVIDFINEVRKTGNVEAMARMALRFGCTMKQAYAIAQWFDLFMAFYFVPKDPEREFLQVHQEPDWNQIAADAGTVADLDGWQSWMNRVLEEEPERAEA